MWSTYCLDLLQKSIFAPLAPQFWGEPEFSHPPILRDLGGIPGFMQDVSCIARRIALYPISTSIQLAKLVMLAQS